jgi:dihydroorotate dehydrogenase
MSGPNPQLRLFTSSLRSAARLPTRSPNTVQCRYASTSSSSGRPSRLKTIIYSGALAAGLWVGYLYVTDTRASVHRWLVPRVLRVVFPDAEDAHHAGTSALKLLYSANLHPRERDTALASAPELKVNIFGAEVNNPIGISAGLDKDGEIPDVLFALGAGVVEIGGCTPVPQAGNPKPRVFRVPSLEGMVNRYGLNSRGADDLALRLRDRLRRFARAMGVTETQVLDGEAAVPPGSLANGRLLAVQIAKNKDTDGSDEKAVADDHVYCVRRLAPYADILVVNVSSPNTPGLRDLQATGPLPRLLTAVVDEASRTKRKQPPKVMVKVSPDEDDETQIAGILSAVYDSGVDGIIVGNTTKRRHGLAPNGVALSPKEQKALMEEGGYSGPAMFDRTLGLIKKYRELMNSQSLSSSKGLAPKVLFATGGITNGEQALQVLNAGASLAMVYTGLVYGGPGTITRIKGEMRDKIRPES